MVNTPNKLGPIELSEGIRGRNVLTLFYASAMTVVFINFINLLHPYLLLEHVGLPEDVHGNFTGNLYIVIEIVTLALTVPLGTLSDRTGRRPIFVAGFLTLTLGLLLLPTARSGEAYIAFRVITSAGIACCTVMTSSVLADYPANNSRGKMVAISGICTGIGVVLVSVLGARIPSWFAAAGYDALASGTRTFMVGASLTLLAAVIARLGLKGGRPAKVTERLPLMTTLREGTAAIRGNSRLLLGCGATFISRGDLTVLASFFSLWLVAVGMGTGMDAAEASAAAGIKFGITQGIMLLFLPVVGVLADRLDRVTMVCIAMALASIGYLALGLIQDPLNTVWFYPAAVFAGAGEAAVIITVPTLVHQEAPVKVRGAVIGVASFFGALGVLVNVKVSGVIFDAWMHQAPFIYMGILNLLMLLWALAVRLSTGAVGPREKVPAQEPAAG